MKDENVQELVGEYQYGFSDEDQSVFKTRRGLSKDIVRQISEIKKEPEWMLNFRLGALQMFEDRPMPRWGNTEILDSIDFENIIYYVKASDRQARSWDDVPESIKDTFERLGVPEAERKFLAGVTAQYESEVVYHSIQTEIEKLGVVFTDMDTGLREHGDLVKQYFGTLVPPNDNKFASLNSAVWSGGSFLYVPPGVHVKIPLQAYFRINLRDMGQFERTLIIVDEGASVHYIEGCTAPTYASDSLHAAVVEVFALPGSKVRYTTIQNWSHNVLNLVTKRARAYAGAQVEWVDGNIGSGLTMKYPAIHLTGEGAHGEMLSVAFAGKGQHQDAGAKVIHFAPNTTSTITSKSISKAGGRSSYRGLVKVLPNATNAKTSVNCDALILDADSRSDTYPTMEIANETAQIGHEATVSKIGDDQMFYLQSRGLSEAEATLMIVNGFIEPFVKELPMEYSVELNRLIQLEMEGSVG
ncbi:MAG: FeS cluster assembly protein SufB [Deltaproteobacteria bacterium ADurb.Bin058]|nr:MAG: FeS cluster assembly protein SufB [Deltaproteobacteria bacterium ADurb.Bin058]